ncbi:Lacal_2735 family protein [Lacinutrix neustonica]|uniref:Lacal_2735 family protein n=1 Tax=Lacinutrix neustonica TaxID=2980107 RepID=A0A9E8SGK4_9FLAO|nr:Lacal_2735 family protein [Lacinutrix neustonica]WAC01820.1 Lacal_2735 family protein [Lacinutrix neustonica]
MSRKDLLTSHQQKLNKRYKQLVEQAYNLSQTDHALSDHSEFKAMKLLHKLNQIKFLSRDHSQPIS